MSKDFVNNLNDINDVNALMKGFNSDIGINVDDYGDGKCRAHIDITEKLCNPWGTVHGGIIYSMADTIGGLAAISKVGMVVTLTGNINYIAPADGKVLLAEGRLIHGGKTTAVSEVEIKNEDGSVAARATLTYYIIKK